MLLQFFIMSCHLRFTAYKKHTHIKYFNLVWGEGASGCLGWKQRGSWFTLSEKIKSDLRIMSDFELFNTTHTMSSIQRMAPNHVQIYRHINKPGFFSHTYLFFASQIPLEYLEPCVSDCLESNLCSDAPFSGGCGRSDVFQIWVYSSQCPFQVITSPCLVTYSSHLFRTSKVNFGAADLLSLLFRVSGWRVTAQVQPVCPGWQGLCNFG